MVDNAAFPKIVPKPHLQLREDLPGQIYTIDGFLSDSERTNVLKWAQAADLKNPTRPGKGEAERTARECQPAGTSPTRHPAPDVMNVASGTQASMEYLICRTRRVRLARHRPSHP
jgi:hypothetical protein